MALRHSVELTGSELAIVWSNLSLVLAEKMEYAEAQSVLEMYVVRVPEDLSARARLVEYRYLSGLGAESRRCLAQFAGPAVATDAAGNRNTSPSPEGTVMKVEGGVEPPVPEYSPQPLYTQEARMARVQGVVILEAIIDKKGRVRCPMILKNLPHGLGRSAVETAMKWRFKPATLKGRPVPVYFNLTTRFSLQ